MNYALALLSGVLLVLVFPGAGLTLLAPVLLAPLLYACSCESRWKHRFLLGWMSGVVFWFGVCYWIQFVLEVHGGMGLWGSWGAFLLFAVLKAFQTGVFAVLAGLLLPSRFAIPGIAALWVALERTHAPMGFTWLLLGDAGTDMSIPMRLAPLTGVYGLSFLFMMMNVAIVLLLLRRPRIQLAWLLSLPLLYLLPAMPAVERPVESLVSVQPNVDETRQWTAESVAAFEKGLVYQSLNAALKSGLEAPKLIVWPEVPAPLYYQSDPQLRQEVAALTRLANTPLLFGTVAYNSDGQPLNSIQFIKRDGEPGGRYDKIHLVPFGEYVPPVFGWVNRITKEAGDFAPGGHLRLFNAEGTRFGAFICYESAFPHFVRRFTEAGAQVLINASNDGYFGHSAARAQHLLLVRMRAAENRRWIVRSTNDGITAAIDPAGRVRQRFPPYVEYAGRLNFSPQVELTLYTRWGDWFVWLCVFAAIALLVLPRIPVYHR
ncbi:MAG: apolipoprotein N-acyltransferase [Bryobacterales bacterium]|nr:apolipoprotein N-acyltransferase [Bryobacterales bacterium]